MIHIFSNVALLLPHNVYISQTNGIFLIYIVNLGRHTLQSLRLSRLAWKDTSLFVIPFIPTRCRVLNEQ